jgi:hypothetical protein
MTRPLSDDLVGPDVRAPLPTILSLRTFGNQRGLANHRVGVVVWQLPLRKAIPALDGRDKLRTLGPLSAC